MMKFEFSSDKVKKIKADLEVILVLKGRFDHAWVADKEELIDLGYGGEAEEMMFLPNKNRLYIGVDSFYNEDLRIAAAAAVRAIGKIKAESLKIGSYGDRAENIKALVEGFVFGAYSFDKYKSKKGKANLKKVIISSEEYGGANLEESEMKAAIKEGYEVAMSVNFVKDVINQTPTDVTPITLAKIAEDLAAENKLEVEIHDEKYLEKEGMGAFLGVSKASPYPPRLIHLKYRPAKAKCRVVLVGKGLTYDSGGLSLKPADSMITMKGDKSGASAVLGIMKAVSRLNLPIEVHGVVGAVENMIGRYAYKPDDVLRARNGKTIEVRNTDAEGRLVLADCLSYAQDLKPDYLVDLATLTGACVVALGEYTIGLMGHNQSLKESFKVAGEVSGELLGDLPFNRYLKKMLKSEVADMSNVSSTRYGGAITAALFLSEFVEDKNKDKWIHLDIAGPAYLEKAWGPHTYGASGAGVRLVLSWLKNL